MILYKPNLGSGEDSKSEDEADQKSREVTPKSKNEEVIKHTFRKFTTELDVKKVANMKSDSPTFREDLLEKYHVLLKGIVICLWTNSVSGRTYPFGKSLLTTAR